ncbi:MAG: 2-hydroxyacyl-CoA dehydratase [Deltaproteobacteria bacterium]|nr:2-hydroxyacyl-CoA dehydratase [Deltaproteobacteria bacterium]
MAETLKTLEEIKKVNVSFPYSDPAKKWKEEGKKIVGWTCINVPEEIIHAGEMMPFRITGGNEELALGKADEILYRGSTCSFIRTCLEHALRGDYDFLDCIASCTSCEGIIRLTEIGEIYHNIPVLPVLDTPRKINEKAYEFYHVEVQDFKMHLEQFFDIRISDKAIADSIKVYNRTRISLRKLYELNKKDEPAVTGSELMEILNAAVRMPREDYNLLLDNLLEEIEATGRTVVAPIRIMISGSTFNATPFIKDVEKLGVVMVIDDFCGGIRYWWQHVEEDVEPMQALAKRYLHAECPCPRTNPSTLRSNRLKEMAHEFKLDGIISLTMRNCAPYVYDLPMWKTKVEDQGIPVLDLDIEYGGGLSGQIKTRIEAFIEMLSLEVGL